MKQREIKFRAWDYQHSRWATNNDVLPSLGLEFDPEAYFLRDGDNHSDRWAFMQFTGLLDRNGKEIYEGDILRCVWGAYIKEYAPQTTIEVVEYLDGCFDVVDGDDRAPLYTIHGDSEVIGNVFEHPHLLEEKTSAR